MFLSGTIELDLKDTKEIPDSMLEKMRKSLVDEIEIKREDSIKIPFVKYCIFPFDGSNNFYSFLFRFFRVKIIHPNN